MGVRLPSWMDIQKFSTILSSYEATSGSFARKRASYASTLNLVRRTALPASCMAQDAFDDGGAVSGHAAHAPAAVMSIAPVGSVLRVWLGAAKVTMLGGRVSRLDDLEQEAAIRCSCGKCEHTLEFFADRGDWKIARMALDAFIPAGVRASIRMPVTRGGVSGRQAEMHSRALVDSARAGCRMAIMAIFFAVGERAAGKDCTENSCKVLSIIVSEDGWSELKRLM